MKDFDNLGEFLRQQAKKHEALNEVMPLAAIWLEKPVNGKVRYTEGDLICLDDDDNIIESDHASHKILGCFGTVDSSILEMMVMDLISNETKIIEL